MNIVSTLLFILGGCLEFISIIVFADLIGILLMDQINKYRIIPALIIFIEIALLALTIKNSFDGLLEVIAIVLYFFRFVIAIYVLFKCFNFKIIYLTSFCELSFSLVGSSLSCIMESLIGESSNYVSELTEAFVQFAILFVFLFLRKKFDTQRNISVLATIPRHIYIMLILSIIFLSAMPSLIIRKTNYPIMKENFLIAIVVILTVIFIFIIASLILNVLAKQHFTAVSQMMQEQVDLQIDHYERLEKMNAEISKFRHDYTNHLQGILSLIKDNDCSEAEKYIFDLRNRINDVKSELHIFDTGNVLADALLSDKASALGEGSKIEYSGIIPGSINKVDLCIILSNALDNAVEACNDLPSPGVISIYATKQQGYFVLSIKNPTACTENYYTIPATTKPDKENHGMGLYNIESTAKKHDGQIKIKCENGIFELTITMKIYAGEKSI